MSEGAYYYLPDKPEPVDLLANPPYATGRDYDAVCGSGAFLAEAAKRITDD